METPRTRTTQQVTREIESERTKLAHAVGDLRVGLGQATDVAGKLRGRLPVVAAGAAGAGFVLAGGVGAAARLLMRRGREGERKARLGRYALVGRR
jgi:hypothetical protein